MLEKKEFVTSLQRKPITKFFEQKTPNYHFSNFVGPQPELTELNEQFLLIQNHNEFKNIDENVPCFDNNEDICDVVNFLKKRKLFLFYVLNPRTLLQIKGIIILLFQ